MGDVSAEQFYQDKLQHFASKADHNKRESLVLFQLLIVCTLASPLFITLSNNWLFGKVVPCLLSSTAAACAIWLQQRKPQQLWTLYRSIQRQLENEYAGYKFSLNDYDKCDDKEKPI